MDSGFAISFFTANNIRLLIISCPTAFSITLKNSSHLEWRVGLSDTILKGTHPGTIYAKFGSIWPSCFRGEDFFNISQSEKRINLGDHVLIVIPR
jgi:hypothetical protein